MINEIITGNNVEILRGFDDGSIDLTVTSPPYDNLRTYNGFSFDFETLAKELYRVTKLGGVVVWVVSDAVLKGSESGTSFRQALYFKDIGFNLHDTMIYQKNSYPFPPTNRYYQQFEYMFVLSKGKPKTSNLLKCESQGRKRVSTTRNADGTTSKTKYETGHSTRIRDNVWLFDTGYMRTTKDKFAYEHPAMFPEQLAVDHILTWSNPGDIVLDPFGGSGTTAKMAKLNGRQFIHIDISEEYNEIARQRIAALEAN
jgi:DNA modification methylase